MSDRIITAEQAYEKVKDQSMVLLDIRRPDEWQKTGIPEGATPLCMDNPEFLSLLEELIDHNKDQQIGIICAAGGRSARVCQALHAQGYNFIFDVSEGMMGGQNGKGWLEKALPTRPHAE